MLVVRARPESAPRPSMVTARVNAATVSDLVAENHFDHLSALASETANQRLTPLAEPHTATSIRPPIDLMKYAVQSGDTPSSIAAKFNLRPETILWGNPGLSNDAGTLQVGQVLNILPVDGVLHVVADGETLETIQQAHSVALDDIVAFAGNHFNSGGSYRLEAGESLIVPNARGGTEWQAPGPRVVAGQGRYSPGYYKGPLANTGTSQFIWPTPSKTLSQDYWAGHPAIDIPLPLGTPIMAADSGTVIFSGWDNTGYGNLIIIDHGNGYWTYYAHNSELLVQAGDGVTQGQTISLAGSTGRSTGSHLDFRIRLNGSTFLNPLDFLP
ncbi:MAG: peptidoglycan DD-metalloendopeptidase family protein [Chloroflexi bacterium]|nr:peptidoglycan DD-metalloendopeptidase family protein [Chloroflexota bacterium]